jgi:imidazolonepropionase-like amidohydrolase
MTRAQLDDIAAVSADPEARFLHPATRQMWEQQNPRHRSGLERFDLRERGKSAVLRTLTRALHQAGVTLLLGSDASAPGMYPGKSAQTELKELVAAGLRPYDALATGTRNAGSVIRSQLRGASPFGTVAVGNRADLLLLRSNPLADIRNIEAIAGVLVGGQWYTRAALDSLRAQQTSN